MRVLTVLHKSNKPEILAGRIYIAMEAVLEDGFKFLLDQKGIPQEDIVHDRADDTGFQLPKEARAIPWDEAPVPGAPLGSNTSEKSALELRLNIARSTVALIPHSHVPRSWAEQALQVLARTDPNFMRQLLVIAGARATETTAPAHAGLGYSDMDVTVFMLLAGHVMRTGLVDILPVELTLFLWDQCVLSTFSLCLPLGAATLLLCLRRRINELRDVLDAKFPTKKTECQQARISNFKRFLRLSGPELSLDDFQRVFREHALPYVRASGLVRDFNPATVNPTTAAPLSKSLIEAALPGILPETANLRPPELSLIEGGTFCPTKALAVNVRKVAARCSDEWPGSTEDIPALEFNWALICAAEDVLASIVDRLLQARENVQILNYLHHIWRHGTKAQQSTTGHDRCKAIDNAVRQELAIAVAGIFPCFAGLYEVLPKAISVELSASLAESLRIDIPVSIQDPRVSKAAAALEEQPITICVILPSPHKARDDLLDPENPMYLCAVVVALRASKCALWPRLRFTVPELAKKVYELYKERCESRPHHASTSSVQVEIERAVEAIAGGDKALKGRSNGKTDGRFIERQPAQTASKASLQRPLTQPSVDSNVTKRPQHTRGVEHDSKSAREYIEAVDGALQCSKSAVQAAIAANANAHSSWQDAVRCRDQTTVEERNEAADQRKRSIDLAVEAVQEHVYRRHFTKEELENNAKLKKVYAKKYSKWAKEFRKYWESDTQLKSAIPDQKALDSVLETWAPRAAPK